MLAYHPAPRTNTKQESINMSNNVYKFSVLPSGKLAPFWIDPADAEPIEIKQKDQSEFWADARSSGLEINDAYISDEILRCRDSRGKAGNKDGWYCLQSNGRTLYGVYGSWLDGSQTHWSSVDPSTLTPAESQEIKTANKIHAKRINRERKYRQAEAGRTAVLDLIACDPATPDHPYLARKNILPFGALVNKKGALVVPVKNCETSEVTSYQKIRGDGSKLFMKTGKIKQGLYTIDGEGDYVYVSEGFATAASIHMATGCTSLVAFSVAQMYAVAEWAKSNYLDKTVIVAPDNDVFKEINAGLRSAQRIEKELNINYILPVFADVSTKPTDFNDLHCLEGLQHVKEQLQMKPKGIDTRLFSSLSTSLKKLENVKNTEFLIDGLIAKGHVHAIIAEAGTGKSALAKAWSKQFAEDGMQVLYCDAESPPQMLKSLAKETDHLDGFLIIAPDYSGEENAGSKDVREQLIRASSIAADLSDTVIIIDTLKNFVDMIDKKQVKKILQEFRTMRAKGATIIILGHTNKRAIGSQMREITFEGTNDIEADVDELTFLHSKKYEAELYQTISTFNKKSRFGGVASNRSYHLDLSNYEITEMDKYDPLDSPAHDGPVPAAKESADIRATGAVISAIKRGVNTHGDILELCETFKPRPQPAAVKRALNNRDLVIKIDREYHLKESVPTINLDSIVLPWKN